MPTEVWPLQEFVYSKHLGKGDAIA